MGTESWEKGWNSRNLLLLSHLVGLTDSKASPGYTLVTGQLGWVLLYKCISPNHKTYLSESQNIFVQIPKCICLSKKCVVLTLRPLAYWSALRVSSDQITIFQRRSFLEKWNESIENSECCSARHFVGLSPSRLMYTACIHTFSAILRIIHPWNLYIYTCIWVLVGCCNLSKYYPSACVDNECTFRPFTCCSMNNVHNGTSFDQQWIVMINANIPK